MRAIVLSDSHGMGYGIVQMLQRIWAMHPGRIDAYIHCGDGASDFFRATDAMKEHDPNAELHVVRGNCDWLMEDDLAAQEIFRFGGANVLLCHGHQHSVKTTLVWMDDEAAGCGCTVTVYGHTHEPNVEARRTLLVNPGSAAEGRFAMLECSGGKVNATLYQV